MPIVSLLNGSEQDSYHTVVVSCNFEVVRKRGFQQVSELGVNMFLLMPCFPSIREHEGTRQLGHCYSTKPQNNSSHGGQHDIHKFYDENSQHLRSTGVPVSPLCATSRVATFPAFKSGTPLPPLLPSLPFPSRPLPTPPLLPLRSRPP